VLEFDEFLKIGGCTHGRHLFAPKPKPSTVCDPSVPPTSLATLVVRTRLADLSTSQTEEFTNCRIDHYQTPANVHVSVFAKQVDKERSTVVFESEKVPPPHKFTEQLMTYVPLVLSISRQIHIDLYLPGGKRFKRSLDLFSVIDPDTSSFKVLGTKVRAALMLGLYLQSFICSYFSLSSHALPSRKFRTTR